MSLPRVVIDGRALTNNLEVARRAAQGAQVMAVIKANAYGHGMVEVARAFRHVPLAVARLAEGLALRAAGLKVRNIVLLEGVLTAAELEIAGAENFELVVHSFEQIELLEAWDYERTRFCVWLKVDTGMNRLGFPVDAFPAAWQRLRRASAVGTLRVMTHLASADERANPMTTAQLTKFQALTQGLGVERSIANSAGILAWPETHCEWVRAGLMLYGISPFPETHGADHGLQPVMTFQTQLIAVRVVRAGETVGYGETWRASREACVGIAAVGYGDGYPRHMASGAPVLVNGVAGKLAGRVSMDMIAIDVTDLPRPRIGDPVTLWGVGLPIEHVAPYATTIPYELTCGITQRVTREWQG